MEGANDEFRCQQEEGQGFQGRQGLLNPEDDKGAGDPRRNNLIGL